MTYKTVHYNLNDILLPFVKKTHNLLSKLVKDMPDV